MNNLSLLIVEGAIGSPQLLQVSGVGNSDNLKKLGIEMIHELIHHKSLESLLSWLVGL